MYFKAGDCVEVTDEEATHWPSYYEANVVAAIPISNQYLVSYKTVYEDVLTPLVEVVSAAEVRPRPPVVTSRLTFGDCVDLFEDGGWWEGIVIGEDVEQGKYYVHFGQLRAGSDSACDATSLRIHQDWRNRRWTRRPPINI